MCLINRVLTAIHVFLWEPRLRSANYLLSYPRMGVELVCAENIVQASGQSHRAVSVN